MFCSVNESARRLEEVAQKKNASMAQVAIAWILSKEGVTALVVGTTNLNNLQDILGMALNTMSFWTAVLTLAVQPLPSFS
jgi:aryl-alcohol dehydrogenase-like predicted oxidoreductase